MTEKIIIKKKGHRCKCKTNINDLRIVMENMEYIERRPQSRIKLMRRTKVLNILKDVKPTFESIANRISYIFKAIRTACQKEFEPQDINRHQSQSNTGA